MAFKYRLELENGEPAEPPTLEAARPDWAPGDTIPLGPGKSLWVVGLRRSDNPNANAVLVVRRAEATSTGQSQSSRLL